VFTHDERVFEIVMLHDELVEALDFVGLDEPHGEVFQDVLLVHSGLTITDLVLQHGRECKELKAGCPAKSINPPCLKDLTPWKCAPYHPYSADSRKSTGPECTPNIARILGNAWNSATRQAFALE